MNPNPNIERIEATMRRSGFTKVRREGGQVLGDRVADGELFTLLVEPGDPSKKEYEACFPTLLIGWSDFPFVERVYSDNGSGCAIRGASAAFAVRAAAEQIEARLARRRDSEAMKASATDFVSEACSI